MKTRAAVLSLLLLTSGLACPPPMPAKATREASGAASGQKSVEARPLGLDSSVLRLVNRGQWQEAAARLKQLSAGDAAGSRNHAWLAFAYLFLGKCDELKKVSEGEGSGGATTTDSGVIAAFHQICEGKLDDAQKTLTALSETAHDDPLVNFALAALCGKRGQAANAVVYCERTVELAPGFGWGFRTLGYLEERWLKDSKKSEAAFVKALEIEPDFREVRDLLVDVYLTRNNFDAAIDVAQNGIKASPRDAASYYRLAQIYLQQWRLREALAQLQKAIGLTPDDARFHRAKASILRYQGQLNDAIAEQQKAVELGKDKAFELIELAALNSAAGNNNRAADNLREALKIEPSHQGAYQRLMQLLLQEQRWGDLVEEYKKALAAKPKDPALHLGLARALKAFGKTEEAIEELKQAANLGELDPQPHRELANILVARQDYSGAAKEYTRSLSINPSSVEDLVALGFCYAHNDDYLQAETAFVTAIALQQLTQMTGATGKGNLNDVTRSLAVLFLTEGRYSEACTQLEAICASPKAPPSDKFLLAEAKALRDRTGSSARALKEAFAELPDEEKDAQRLALIDALLKSGQTAEAAALVAAAPDPKTADDIHWLTVRARAARLNGDYKNALEYASQAVSSKGGDPESISEAYLEKGLAAMAAGDLNQADNDIRKSIEVNPKSFVSYEASGRVYMAKKDWAHALDSAKRSQEINPYFAPSYMLIGDSLLAQGKVKEASSTYKKAVELYPGLLEAHKALFSTYEKLSMKDEARSEAELIAQIEKRQ